MDMDCFLELLPKAIAMYSAANQTKEDPYSFINILDKMIRNISKHEKINYSFNSLVFLQRKLSGKNCLQFRERSVWNSD